MFSSTRDREKLGRLSAFWYKSIINQHARNLCSNFFLTLAYLKWLTMSKDIIILAIFISVLFQMIPSMIFAFLTADEDLIDIFIQSKMALILAPQYISRYSIVLKLSNTSIFFLRYVPTTSLNPDVSIHGPTKLSREW